MEKQKSETRGSLRADAIEGFTGGKYFLRPRTRGLRGLRGLKGKLVISNYYWFDKFRATAVKVL